MGNIVNRVFDSSGPEGKVRGTPQQIIDKYTQLTRDAQLSNDRVAAENFQQHAEHYTRMLGEAQREQDARRAEQEAQQQARDSRQNRDTESDQPRAEQPKGQQQDRSSDQPARADTPEPASRDAAEGAQKSFDDVIDVPASGDSGLVQTPESAPKPKAKRTRRSPKKADSAPKETSGDSAQDAATPSAPEGGPQAAE